MQAKTLRPAQRWVTRAFIFLATLAVCLPGSWIPSIWADEGATISASTRSFGQLLALVQNIDMVHAFYYALMSAWFHIAPVDAFWLRFPSAIAVALTAVLLHVLAATWLEPRRALLVVAVFVALPRVTWMAVEGRSWAFSTLVVVALTLAAVRWSATRRSAWLLVYGSLLALGVALHVYVVFMIAAHGVSLVVTHRRQLRQLLPWLTSSLVGFLAVSPVWWVSSRQVAQLGNERLGLLTWLRQAAVNEFFLGETPGPGSVGVFDLSWHAASVALAFVTWSLVVWGLVKAGRRPGQDSVIVWTVPWLVLPSMAVLAWSLFGHSMFNPRYFAFSAPALAALLVHSVAALRGQRLRIAALVLVPVLALPVYLSQRIPRAKEGADWAEVASWVAAHSRPGDGVYFAPAPTTRTIAIAYPEDFAGLGDLTLVRPAPEDASLAGENESLIVSLRANPPAETFAVWRIRAAGYDEDRAAFASAGYVPAETWTGSTHVVVRYVRAG